MTAFLIVWKWGENKCIWIFLFRNYWNAVALVKIVDETALFSLHHQCTTISYTWPSSWLSAVYTPYPNYPFSYINNHSFSTSNKSLKQQYYLTKSSTSNRIATIRPFYSMECYKTRIRKSLHHNRYSTNWYTSYNLKIHRPNRARNNNRIVLQIIRVLVLEQSN